MENANPTRNPYTTVPGAGLLLLSLFMVIAKYVLPLFMELKQQITYEWYVPFIIGGAGLLLVYMSDAYFSAMFGVGLDAGKSWLSRKPKTEEEKK